jgi:hypothetical protein
MRSPRPKAGCGAGSPSSTGDKRRTWSRWCTAASTAPPRWPNSSASAAPRSTAPSNANASKPELASRSRHRDADTSTRRRLSRIRHPCGTTTPRQSRMGLSPSWGSPRGTVRGRRTLRDRVRRGVVTHWQLPVGGSQPLALSADLGELGDGAQNEPPLGAGVVKRSRPTCSVRTSNQRPGSASPVRSPQDRLPCRRGFRTRPRRRMMPSGGQPPGRRTGLHVGIEMRPARRPRHWCMRCNRLRRRKVAT